MTKLSSRSATNFTGRPKQLRQRGRRHLVCIGVNLDAEGAADILGHHPHLVLLKTEVLGKQVLHHVRRLGALIDRETLVARVPIGDDRARLHGHAGVPAEAERGFNHRVGLRKRLIRRAGFKLALESEIVAQLRMDDWRRRIERSLRIRDRRQLLVGRLRPTRTHPRHARGFARQRRHTASPCQQARSTASGYCGADLIPLRWVSTPTHGVMAFASSAPVTTATTPAACLAAAVSMLLMRACACGERTKATCAMRGNVMSLTYWARPWVSRARLGRGTERPI